MAWSMIRRLEWIDMKEKTKSSSQNPLIVDRIISKSLAKMILDTELAEKVSSGNCKTLLEADEMLAQLDDLAYYTTRLKVYALENKAIIAGDIAEKWLPNELYKKIVAERKEKYSSDSIGDFSSIELEYMREAIAKVRQLLFVESKEVSFKNVICTSAWTYEQDGSAIKLVAKFSWQDPKCNSDFPNLKQKEVRIIVPFGKTAKVCNGNVKGGIDVDLVVGSGAWDSHCIFSNTYDVQHLRDILAKTLAIGKTEKLKEFANPNSSKRIGWYDFNDMLEDLGYSCRGSRFLKNQVDDVLYSDGSYWYSPLDKSIQFG